MIIFRCKNNLKLFKNQYELFPTFPSVLLFYWQVVSMVYEGEREREREGGG